MNHIVLLGDSIFDNERYVPGGTSVIQLRRGLPAGCKATLLAVDGAITDDIMSQLARLPADATHLIVSAGGNNALANGSAMLHEQARLILGAMERLAEVRLEFQRDYRAMLDALMAKRLPVMVCTVYDSVPGLSIAEQAALSVFNEVILREAVKARVPVLDLRILCTDPDDYATTSPIEPSVTGGGKIARAIVRALTGADDELVVTRIYQ